MKKFISSFMALVVFTLFAVACGGEDKQSSTPPPYVPSYGASALSAALTPVAPATTSAAPATQELAQLKAACATAQGNYQRKLEEKANKSNDPGDHIAAGLSAVFASDSSKCAETQMGRAHEFATQFTDHCQDLQLKADSEGASGFNPEDVKRLIDTVNAVAQRECKELTAKANSNPLLLPGDGTQCGGHMEKDEVRLIPINCTASGDVSTGSSANGPWHFEGKSKATDGTIVIVKNQPTWVKAPYEANVDGQDPNKVEADMKKSGCTFKVNGKPCQTVTIVTK